MYPNPDLFNRISPKYCMFVYLVAPYLHQTWPTGRRCKNVVEQKLKTLKKRFYFYERGPVFVNPALYVCT